MRKSNFPLSILSLRDPPNFAASIVHVPASHQEGAESERKYGMRGACPQRPSTKYLFGTFLNLVSVP
jgi:hypothetical protein